MSDFHLKEIRDILARIAVALEKPPAANDQVTEMIEQQAEILRATQERLVAEQLHNRMHLEGTAHEPAMPS